MAKSYTREIDSLEDHAPLIHAAMARALALYKPPPPMVSISPIEPFRRFKGREIEMASEIFGIKLWEFQRHLIDKLNEPPHRVAVAAARKVSKTFSGGFIVLAFELSHETIGLTTAPFGQQVDLQLWERIHALADIAKARGVTLPGKLTDCEYHIGPEHYAVGMTTTIRANATSAAGFRGWHAGVVVPDDPDGKLTVEALEKLKGDAEKAGVRRLLIVIDEATDVHPAVFNALEGSMSGPNVYVLLMMNPTLDADSPHPAVRAFARDSGYYKIRVSALSEEEDPDKEVGDLVFDRVFHAPTWMIDPAWIAKQRRELTETSPLWYAFVRGIFPSQSVERRFISRALLDQALTSYELETPREIDWFLDVRPGVHMGVDLARSLDGDECVASLVVDGILTAQHVWSTDDLMVSAGVVADLMRKWGQDGKPIPARNVHVDSCGIGGGVVDRLKQIGLRVDAVDVGMAPWGDWGRLVGETGFKSRKSELHWVVRRCLEEGLAVIPKKYTQTWHQAQWTRFEIVGKSEGSVVAIHKDDEKEGLRKRYSRSPDHWDSFMLAFSRRGGEPGIRVLGPRTRMSTINEIFRRGGV